MGEWITLHDTTIRIDSITSITPMMEKGEYIFIVECNTKKIYYVNLISTGGKWLYMQMQRGMAEAERGGIEYDRL
jgi:hypothetical protein